MTRISKNTPLTGRALEIKEAWLAAARKAWVGAPEKELKKLDKVLTKRMNRDFTFSNLNELHWIVSPFINPPKDLDESVDLQEHYNPKISTAPAGQPGTIADEVSSELPYKDLDDIRDEITEVLGKKEGSFGSVEEGLEWLKSIDEEYESASAAAEALPAFVPEYEAEEVENEIPEDYTPTKKDWRNALKTGRQKWTQRIKE